MMNMIDIKRVKIGYKDYDISCVSSLDDHTSLLYGKVDFQQQTIRICNRYSADIMKCTLVHETIHAIDDISDIGLTEEQVVKLGKGIYQLIKDNPDLFK